MLTAQAVLIIAAVAFVGVAITGSRQFVQIKIPELKIWRRWALAIIGAGFFASAFFIPTIAGQSSAQIPQASSGSVSTGGGSPSPSTSAPEPVVSGPIVHLTAPSGGASVPEAKGFTAGGTVSGLGDYTLWLTDFDGGYTVDTEATVNANGTWTAGDSDLGNPGEAPPFSRTVRLIRADTNCAATLYATSQTTNDYLNNLPGGCTVVAQVTVRVTTP
jgi:hypothetical protein